MVRPENCNSTENSQLTDQPGNMENHDDITKELTQYVLCSASIRGYCKELELRKLLDITTNEFQSAMIDANKRLQEVAGCQIINSSGRSYVVNMLNHSEECFESDNIQEDAKNGLLTVILIFIFMAKKPLMENVNVTDTMLWDFLGEFGLTRNTADSYFGDINKLIAPSYSADFINKGWIEFHKSVDRSETEQITYDWGPRAKVSVDPMKVLEAFCEIIDDHPKYWTDYFERAQQLRKE